MPSAGRVFQVSGLDCVEEVRILKRAIGPLVGGHEQLSFDVLNGRMSISGEAEDIGDKRIADAIAATGMSATRVGDPNARPGADHRKTYMTILSGVAILIGMLLHVLAADRPLNWHTVLNAHADTGTPLPETVAWLLATAAGIRHVLPKAWYSLKTLRPDMNLLMTIAVVGAIAIGELFEAATVAFLFALSLTLESWSVGRARKAVAALLELAPSSVRIIDDNGEERDVLPADVPIGTHFIVRAGDRIALDGEVFDGMGSVDQAPITGESIPVAKMPGDEVFAGTINGEGTLTVKATQAAQDTVLARITRSIGDAHAKRAAVERWVDAFARRYTPVVMIIALLVLLVPPLAFSAAWQPWVYNALVLLVIACPCALVISTPVSVVAALASAARSGVLIKGGTYVELPARLDALALDKTGTLTQGKPVVQKIVALDGRSEQALLSDAAALESRSSHPLATAVLNAAREEGLAPLPADDVQILAGRGVRGRVQGRPLWIGSSRFARETLSDGAELSYVLEQHIVELEQAGNTVVVVGAGNQAIGVLALADALRPEARAMIAMLHRQGVKEIVMLTGDHAITANAVAAAAGIDTVRAGLLPEDKVSEIEALMARHEVVAMIGDGVNDAPAMARASFGVAMGAIGSDAAIETADIALMSDELERLPWLIRHSRRTLTVIRQNIVFSLALKAVFVIMTVFGIATLWGAIAADVGATLLVVANALRLLRLSDRHSSMVL
ncbi:heavy metal translocating P-type ATPase [Granulosicoccus sp. 3-233]|uniref:heavy metal translocating P-type ATPase n=1 Tax=Granulosicoccus sp. 3-233 TaxID=3417969 RepID=UPI003D34608A